MKKVVLLVSTLLLGAFTLSAQINMGMGVNITENPDGSVNMDMQMDTPEGTIKTSQTAGPNGVSQSMDVNTPEETIKTRQTVTTQTQTQTVWQENAPVAAPRPTPAPPRPAPAPDPIPVNRCYPMAPQDFNAALNSIKSKSFSDTKLTLAKQILSTNCITAMQARAMAQEFTFEADKLAFAKLAYASTVDKNNYFQVNDIFDFESSIEELAEFIATQPR